MSEGWKANDETGFFSSGVLEIRRDPKTSSWIYSLTDIKEASSDSYHGLQASLSLKDLWLAQMTDPAH